MADSEIVIDDCEAVPVAASLTLRNTARELAAAFREAEADVRSAFATIVEAERRVNAVFLSSDGHRRAIQVDATGYGYHDSFDKPDVAINRMRRAAWDVIVARLGLRMVMSVKAWEKLQAQIGDDRSKEPVPELSDENIDAFVVQNVVSFSSMIAEAVREVYDWLRPRSRSTYGAGKYKTNSLYEVPAKVVLPSLLETGPYATKYRVHRRSQELACLERVFQNLDGRGSVSKVFTSELEIAIESAECAASGTFATRYFSGRCYANGNVHLSFTRSDLLAEFNAVAGGKVFRPAPRAT